MNGVNQNKLKAALQLIGFIMISQLTGVIGSIGTQDSIDRWYAALQKPRFTPPDWVFGPAWEHSMRL